MISMSELENELGEKTFTLIFARALKELYSTLTLEDKNQNNWLTKHQDKFMAIVSDQVVKLKNEIKLTK